MGQGGNMQVNPRALTVRVLLRVLEQECFAVSELDQAVQSIEDERDVRLMTETVYGVLRKYPLLRSRLEPLVRRSWNEIESGLKVALLVGAYQLWYLRSVTVYAAVDQMVSVTRELSGRKAAGFVNAVLRKAAKASIEDVEHGVVLLPWLRGALLEGLDEARLDALCGVGAERRAPPCSLRVRYDVDLETVRLALMQHAPRSHWIPGSLSSRSLLGWGGGNLRNSPGFSSGEFWLQDQGAQLSAEMMDVRPGDRVLDLCAGHGGKTLVLVEKVGKEGSVVAVDKSLRSLSGLEAQIDRIGIRTPVEIVHAKVEEISRTRTEWNSNFDHVLVDAPCTGLGTLWRRPEIGIRLQAEDIDRMRALQLRLLTEGAQYVRLGGRLGYIVCSVTTQEGVSVADAFSKRFPGYKPITRVGDRLADSDGVFRIGPWLDGQPSGLCDGYQMALWERVSV